MKKALVIIGACCSFGKETISELVSQYDALILTETEERYSELKQYLKRLKETHTEKTIISYVLDVRRTSEINEVFTSIEKECIFIHSLVYCAGINIISPALSLTEDKWDMVMDINLKGFFFVAKETVAHMLRNDIKGSIVSIASQHSVVVNFDRSAYCASKAALTHLSKELALEFSEENIRFNTVSPSYISSEINRELLSTPRSQKEYLSKVPMKRYAEPKDIALAIKYLLSDDSSFVTGHNLLVDGGYTIT